MAQAQSALTATGAAASATSASGPLDPACQAFSDPARRAHMSAALERKLAIMCGLTKPAPASATTQTLPPSQRLQGLAARVARASTPGGDIAGQQPRARRGRDHAERDLAGGGRQRGMRRLERFGRGLWGQWVQRTRGIAGRWHHLHRRRSLSQRTLRPELRRSQPGLQRSGQHVLLCRAQQLGPISVAFHQQLPVVRICRRHSFRFRRRQGDDGGRQLAHQPVLRSYPRRLDQLRWVRGSERRHSLGQRRANLDVPGQHARLGLDGTGDVPGARSQRRRVHGDRQRYRIGGQHAGPADLQVH